MAFSLPVWFAVQEELLGHEEPDCEARNTFDEFDDEELFDIFHLSRPCIEFIADTVRLRMQSQPFEQNLSVDEMLLLALDYYANGVSSFSVLRRVGLVHVECPTVIAKMSGVLAGMADQFISFPQTEEARADVASKIEELCGIPKVLGVLGTAHFKIRASPYEKDTFRSFVNTLGFTSVVSQMICDSDGNIMSVEKCCVGSTYDQELWESSFKGREIMEGLHGSYWVIGGRGYQPSEHMLTSVSEPADYNEARFNEAHTRVHNVMQAMLNAMKRRFRCLLQLGFTQDGPLDKKCNIVKACSVLHNVAKKFSVPLPPTALKAEPLRPAKQHSMPVQINPEAIRARRELINASFFGNKRPNTKDTIAEDVVL